MLYKNCPLVTKNQVRGNGFTLYSGLLDDLPIDRYEIVPKLSRQFYDLVVFSNVWRQFAMLFEFQQYLSPKNTVFLDGEDTAQVYPYAGKWLRNWRYWTVPTVHRQFLYFKREWTPFSKFTMFNLFIPNRFKSKRYSRSLREIGFAIPEEKIVQSIPEKHKDFPMHVVDQELLDVLPRASSDYVFESESMYYHDLQASRFGVTTKRAGWDCLRHYEIAANAAVPCFRNLSHKPRTCAPHGLTEKNCIEYSTPNSLLETVSKLSKDRYQELQHNALAWARKNTTVERAKEILGQINVEKVAS